MPAGRFVCETRLVDFDLSDDQLALRDAARDLLDGLALPDRVRAHTNGSDLYDTALWSAMVEQGWLGVELPEAAGGLGLGAVESAVLLEEIGRHVAPVPFRSTALAIGACARAGTRRRRCGTPLGRGDRVRRVVAARRVRSTASAGDRRHVDAHRATGSGHRRARRPILRSFPPSRPTGRRCSP